MSTMPLTNCYTRANITGLMTIISLMSSIVSLAVPLVSMIGHMIVLLSSGLTLVLQLVSKCPPTTTNQTAVALEEEDVRS